MRTLLAYILLLTGLALKAQDKIYLQDGTSFSCKVTEISGEKITYLKSGETSILDRYDVVLIEFKNGLVEIITPPQGNIVYSQGGIQKQKKSPAVQNQNYFSVNSAALVNADISGFYEYMLKNKKLGFGVMGAYNFNLNANLTNAFIAILPNAKKNYDIGVTCNYYPGNPQRKMRFFTGIMIKYTDFSFRRELRDSTTLQGVTIVNLTYKSTKGSQLATIFNFGLHSAINEHFFVKSFLGIGAFKLKGDYKQQINLELNKNRPSGSPVQNRNFLAKLYVGINIGYNF